MKNIFVAIVFCAFSLCAFSDVVDFAQWSEDGATFLTEYDHYDDGYMAGVSTKTWVGCISISSITTNEVTTDLDDQLVTFCGAIHTDWEGESAYDGIQQLGDVDDMELQIGILCDLFHLGSYASDWDSGATVAGTAYSKQAYYTAFQLAVWDITLGDDLSLSSDEGEFYYESGLDADAIALGDYMLGQVQSSFDNGDGYTSEVFRLTGEVSEGVSNQDLVVVSNVPEPLTISLLGISGLFLLGVRRLNGRSASNGAQRSVEALFPQNF